MSNSTAQNFTKTGVSPLAGMGVRLVFLIAVDAAILWFLNRLVSLGYLPFAFAVLLKGSEQYTLMVGLQVFAGAQFNQRWGVFAAGVLIGALPIMIIYLILQDQIVGGLTQGAVKG